MSKQTPVVGSFNHMCLSVSDYDKSIKFYDSLLGKIGYKQIVSNEHYTSWLNSLSGGNFVVCPAHPEKIKDFTKHDKQYVGFHHLAFNASSREQVDEIHKFLSESKATILDEPKEYKEYSPGYYAVYWEDPDGMKLELCHVPIPTTKEDSETVSADDTNDTNGKEPEGKDHEGNGENDENSPKRQKIE